MRPHPFLAFVLMLAAAALALADKPKKKKSKQKAEVTVSVIFTAQQRDDVRLFFARKHGRGHCPPGLAKKDNGCLPPGLAKKRYAVGERLPATLEILPLPLELSVHVGAPSDGYRYVIVDGDLVKLVAGTMLVVDAIDGLVE